MNIVSGWNFLAMVAVCLLLISPTRLFRFVDGLPSGTNHKLETLDGLRGFLALGVVGQHLVEMNGYLKTGVWTMPSSNYYIMLGEVGVAIFFMITGYLFWSKPLQNSGKVDWFGLYLGRLFRIVPLYIVMLVGLSALIFYRSGGAFLLPVKVVTLQILQWLGFGFFGYSDINGQSALLLTFGVTWTLRYEWIFYISLPALALCAGKKSHLLLVAVALCISAALTKPHAVINAADIFSISCFLCGMFAASVHRKFGQLSLRHPAWSCLAILIIVYVLNFFPNIFSWKAILLCGAFFLLVSSGANLFGLLWVRAAKRLGAISYGIYLLQGPILTTIFSKDLLGTYAMQGSLQFLIVSLLAVASLVVVAATTFALIERPGIAFGKRLHAGYSKARNRRDTAPQPTATGRPG